MVQLGAIAWKPILERGLGLHPPGATRAPAWDLPLVLKALCSPPFDPLAQAGLKWVILKTVFLLAISSAKCVYPAVHPVSQWLVSEVNSNCPGTTPEDITSFGSFQVQG